MFEEYLHYAARTRAQEARQDLGSNVFERNPWNFGRKRHPESDSAGSPIQNANALSKYDGKPVQLSELSQVQNSTSQGNAENQGTNNKAELSGGYLRNALATAKC